MGQDTPHGLPATRCPPWPTHGCQGPQKSGRVGKSLQNAAAQSLSSLGWERVPGAEQGQGLLPQFHGFGGKVDAWSWRDGSIPGVLHSVSSSWLFHALGKGEILFFTGIAMQPCLGSLCWSSLSMCCSCSVPILQAQCPQGSFPAVPGIPGAWIFPFPPRWNAPRAGKGSVGFTAGKTPQIPSRR